MIAHLQRYEIFNIITVTVRRDWYHNRINYNRRIVSNCVYERAGEGRGGEGVENLGKVQSIPRSNSARNSFRPATIALPFNRWLQ